MEKLIPASNFKVMKIKKLIKLNNLMSVLLEGYGIWSISEKGWVSINDNVKGVPVPYVLKKKSVALDVIKDGLYEGYQIIK